MKKGLAHKTNTFRVQSQTGKMKRFLQEILRGDLFIQVCKQVKEQARKEGSKAKMQSWEKTTGQHRTAPRQSGILCQHRNRRAVLPKN